MTPGGVSGGDGGDDGVKGQFMYTLTKLYLVHSVPLSICDNLVQVGGLCHGIEEH